MREHCFSRSQRPPKGHQNDARRPRKATQNRENPVREHVRNRIENACLQKPEIVAKVALGNQSLGLMPLPKLWPIYTPNSGVRCGENRHAPISRVYQPPFVFDQTLNRVTIDVDIG